MTLIRFSRQLIAFASVATLFAAGGLAADDSVPPLNSDSMTASSNELQPDPFQTRPGGGHHGGGGGHDWNGGHPGGGHPGWGGHPGGGYPGHPGGGYPGHPGGPGYGHHHGPHDPWFGHGGGYPWAHWHHPVHGRPVYDWDWRYVRAVTCVAQDSAGDLYPVTEDGYTGWGFQSRLEEIEDAAMDYCYHETGGDYGCHLDGCHPGY